MRLLSDKSGFGKVYEAFDRSTPKILKVLKGTYNHHPKAVELFKQEAVVLGQLPHPGIPAIEPQSYFEYFPKGNAEPLHCIVMEKIDGPNLREWMLQQGNNPIGEKQAVRWLRQLTEILQLVHQKNYFHRDIKPENVMLRSNGQLVLVDFGAAREMTYTYLAQMGNTGSGTRISSAGYTPPEQERGQAVPQSDFYALGYTLIYLLTGKQPTDHEIYDSMQNEAQWRQAAPHISSEFADLIDRLIAPRASDRPKTAAEILQSLAELEAQKEQAQAAAPTLLQHQATRSQTGQSQVHPERLPLKWLIGGAAVLLLAIGGMAIWQMNPINLLPTQGQSAKLLRSIDPQSGRIQCLIFTPDGQRLILGTDHQTIQVWSVDSGQLLLNLTGHTSTIKSLMVKSDGSVVVSGSDDQTIRLWNLGMGQSLGILRGHTSYLNAVAFSPDGQFLASASADQTVKLWNLQTQQEVRTFRGHTSYVNAVVFSPDGQFLASAGADQTIKIWNVNTGQEIRTLQGHTSYVNAIEFTPDGQQLVSASADQTLKVWNVKTGEVVRTLKGHRGFVEDLAISPDGQRLISGGSDQTLKIWDLATGQVLHTLTGFHAHIKRFAVSPDWQTVAVATETTVKIAELPAD